MRDKGKQTSGKQPVKKSYVIAAVVIIEIIIVAASAIFFSSDNLLTTELTGNNLLAQAENSAVRQEGDSCVIYNPDTNQDGYEEAEVIAFDPVVLPKGSYDVTLLYDTDRDNNYFVIPFTKDQNIDALYIEDLIGWLSSRAEEHVSHVRVRQDDSELTLQIHYWGSGEFTVRRVLISQTNEDVVWHATDLIGYRYLSVAETADKKDVFDGELFLYGMPDVFGDVCVSSCVS